MKKLTFAIIFLTLIACEEKLPKPTQEGNNTFGCQVNGKTWIPNGGTGFMSAKPINGGFFKILSTDPQSYIYIRTYNKNKERVDFFIEGQKVGTYLLNETTGYQPNQLYPKNYGLVSKDGETYVTSKQNTGKVIIEKAEFGTGIISGTFEFIAGTGTKTITITKGRFDINTRTLN